MDNLERIHIGTSGWNYKHWRGPFYPKDLSQKKWLEFYIKKFHTVEINNSFYQLPEKTTFENWRDTVTEGFIFSVKASRYITHMKKLKEPNEALDRFLNRIEALKDKLGPILFQLPPRWKCNCERLKSFLNMMPDEFRYTFEFRDDSWWNDDVYEALSNHKIHGAALDVHDTEPLETDSKWRSLSNVCLSPHIAAATGESLKRASKIVARDIALVLRGDMPYNRVTI